MSVVVARVAELWRYPVKSLQGEQRAQLRCDGRGVEADRRWALEGADGRLASGKTTGRFRRMPGLLSMGAELDGAGRCWLRFADGSRADVADPGAAARASAVVNEPVHLVEEVDHPLLDDAPLHLLSLATLAWLAALRPADVVDARRFRPNVVLDVVAAGRPEDAWVGQALRLGEAVVRIGERATRCVVPTLAQDGLRGAPGLLGTLHEHAEDRLGVYGSVERPGWIRVGDPVCFA